MRLSTNTIYQQNMGNMLDNEARFQTSGIQLATGRRVNQPSDDPLAASQEVRTLQAQAQNNQFAMAQNFAIQSISTEATATDSINSTISAMKLVIVSAGNGSLNDDDRLSYATQLEGMKANLVNLANSTDGNGNYIFGGYKSDKPPYTVDKDTGKVSYNGGTDAIMQQVSAERSMVVSHTGPEVFNAEPGNPRKEPDGSIEYDLFKTIDDALVALKTPSADRTSDEYTAAMDKATRGLTNSENNVANIVSQQGTQLAELDDLGTIGTAQNTTTTNQLSGLVNIDEVTSIYNYTIQQNALQASMKAFSSMQSLSLFQMK